MLYLSFSPNWSKHCRHLPRKDLAMLVVDISSNASMSAVIITAQYQKDGPFDITLRQLQLCNHPSLDISVLMDPSKCVRKQAKRTMSEKCKDINGALHFAEVRYFFEARLQLDHPPAALALVSVYGPPDQNLLASSSFTVWSCTY
ncbi:uncharacterized protein F5147DRAFT_776408 [Suillus discolor]|uniref:Uncharacterized protein n=1 Tax=Suillus discolor TaxID=1912936 RepID=A0A9P7F343_9AGAM|nr:uncharacterized protein F5147DRAFT_776408 [Suillus discolor]KAG2102258.1 hypothetical protein F5147DRAFT_776408 [Suillus discolor]